MKLTHYIYISTALALLTACSDDDLSQRGFTVGEADNAIVLQAGVSEGGSGVQTRAVDDNHAVGANGGGHKTLASDIKLALQVCGTWTGHDPVELNPITTATIGSGVTVGTETVATHNKVTFEDAEKLYWDDFGTADPANIGSGKGREKGLTIYGAAVNDATASAPTVPTASATGLWDKFSWKVCLDSEPSTGTIDQSNGWSKYDLITSNNIHEVESGKDYDGTLKFDDLKPGNTPSNILEFTHAMTKITVELCPGAGFANKFENDPEVILKGFYYTGNVDVIAKTSIPTSSSTADIKMHLSEKATTGLETVTFDALVFPGNSWTNLEAAKAATILTLSADGNDYSVTAEQLYNAMTNKVSPSHSALLQGWNYKLVIIVNKTAIDVIATVVNWKEVTADEEAPKINVTEFYGHTGTAFGKDFDFFRSITKASGYSNDAYIEYNTTDSKYVWHNQLYWPTHNTHYFFRGVWPRIGADDQTAINNNYTTKSNVDDAGIKVQNIAYASGTYPSDLMMARPLKEDDTTADETCKVAAHKDSEGKAPEGICATEGEIRMNFHYMMSQVLVKLTTSSDEAKVLIDNNTKVEIIGGYKTGAIAFSNCSTAAFESSDKSDYTLSKTKTSGGEVENDSYHDAIIPQSLEGLKFRITVTNSDNSIDVYECPIKDIKVSENGSTPAPVNEWAAGKKYTYNLTVKKTAIKVSATLTDWIPVEAKEDVWF